MLLKNRRENVYKKLILSIIIQLSILFLFHILLNTAFLKIPSILRPVRTPPETVPYLLHACYKKLYKTEFCVLQTNRLITDYEKILRSDFDGGASIMRFILAGAVVHLNSH